MVCIPYDVQTGMLVTAAIMGILLIAGIYYFFKNRRYVRYLIAATIVVFGINIGLANLTQFCPESNEELVGQFTATQNSQEAQQIILSYLQTQDPSVTAQDINVRVDNKVFSVIHNGIDYRLHQDGKLYTS